jgi:hypothetical protein
VVVNPQLSDRLQGDVNKCTVWWPVCLWLPIAAVIRHRPAAQHGAQYLNQVMVAG